MEIHESGEDYLESILILKQTHGYVRSIDVARHKNYSKPSVSRAMGLLKESGYIVIDKDGLIDLTDSGQQVAERIYERHQLLTRWLVSLGVTPEVAAAEACHIEHDVSEDTFQKMKDYILREIERP